MKSFSIVIKIFFENKNRQKFNVLQSRNDDFSKYNNIQIVENINLKIDKNIFKFEFTYTNQIIISKQFKGIT